MALRIKSLKFVPPVFPGFKRSWRECRKCGQVFADQYVPFSMSSAVRVLPCGHMEGTVAVSDEQSAMRRMIEQRCATLARTQEPTPC